MTGKRKREASSTVDSIRDEDEEMCNGAEGSSNGSAIEVRDRVKRTPPHRLSQGTISWEVDKVSAVDDSGKNSPTITLMGIKWYMRIRTETSERTHNETQFSVYIYCQEKNHLDIWYADVQSHIRLINRHDNKHEKVERFSYRFTRNLNNSGYASFMKRIDVLCPREGFIFEDKITIEADIDVIKVYGLDTPHPVTDFTVRSGALTDCCLLVEGKKLYISKPFLAINSPVFEALFYRGFKESKQKEIELEDLRYSHFVEMLHVLHDSERPITPNNAAVVLRIADRFQIKAVMKRVEHFLCTCYQFPDFAMASRLLLADQFNLFEAQHAIISKLIKTSDVTSLKNQRDFVPISDTLKLRIAELQIQMLTKNCST